VLTANRLHALIISIHGVMAFVLGLILLYLGAGMTNRLVELIDVVVAIMLSAAALILAGVTDWYAAFGEGTKHIRRLTFYFLAGTGLVLVGIFLVANPRTNLEWLVLLASAHAFAFGAFALFSVWKVRHRKLDPGSLFTLGVISIICSACLTFFTESGCDRSATLALGAYLCFVGAKMLYFARRTYSFEGSSDDPIAEQLLTEKYNGQSSQY
jgi:hypothetical protein